MQCQLRYRPQLDVLEDRLPPGDLYGGIAEVGQFDTLQDTLVLDNLRGGPDEIGQSKVLQDTLASGKLRGSLDYIGQPFASNPQSPAEVAPPPPPLASAPPSHGHSALMPPQSHAFGRSLEEWGFLYTSWAIETNLAAETDLTDTVGRVRFLPTVTAEGAHTFSLTLRPGTPFVASPFFVFGERYDNPAVPDDNPQDPFVDFIFDTAEIQVVLDGRVVLDGTGTELSRFMFGPRFFAEPIVYAEPQPRGPGLNAVAALWVQGIGTVFHPLPVGRHTLMNTVDSVLGDFQFTYHIRVSPGG